MKIKKLITVRTEKQIIAIFTSLCIMLFSFFSVSQTVHASALPVEPEVVTEIVDFCKYVAEQNGIEVATGATIAEMSSSGLTASMLIPYLQGVLVVGAVSYLGYDITTNWDSICLDITDWLHLKSGYADEWFRTYGESILNGSYDLSQGIQVPTAVWHDMTVCLSEVLTYDLSSSFEQQKTCLRGSGAWVSADELKTWVTSLGYAGTVSTSWYSYSPVICIYNQELQDYTICRASGYTNKSFKDLLLSEVDGKLYAQVQYRSVVDDIGYAMQSISNSGVSWETQRLGVNSSNLKPPFDMSKLKIENGVATYMYNDTPYTLSFLSPSDSSIVLGNLKYSELKFPLSYRVSEFNLVYLLPWYWNVTGVSVEPLSVLDTQVNTQPNSVPQSYKDCIDDSLENSENVPLPVPLLPTAQWVADPSVDSTSSITDQIQDTDTNPEPNPNPDTGTGIFPWLQNIINAIKSLPQAIADAFNNLLQKLFVPSAETIAETESMLHQKLPVIDSIASWVDELMKIMQNPNDYASTLSFTVDMSKATDTYWNYGNSKTSALSMTWYTEKYKSTVDDIIVGIAWLIFLWNLHCMLPSIISAVSTVHFNTANISYQKDGMELRNAEMEFRKENLEVRREKMEIQKDWNKLSREKYNKANDKFKKG